MENQLRERNHLKRWLLKIASTKFKTWYDVHSNSVGFEGYQVSLYYSKHDLGCSPKLQGNKLGRSLHWERGFLSYLIMMLFIRYNEKGNRNSRLSILTASKVLLKRQFAISGWIGSMREYCCSEDITNYMTLCMHCMNGRIMHSRPFQTFVNYSSGIQINTVKYCTT